MVFDRRFTAALTSIQRIRLERSNEQRASPAATGSLRPLDPVLLNGVRWRPLVDMAINRSPSTGQLYETPGTNRK